MATVRLVIKLSPQGRFNRVKCVTSKKSTKSTLDQGKKADPLKTSTSMEKLENKPNQTSDKIPSGYEFPSALRLINARYDD